MSIFKALADPTRRAILDLVRDEEMNAGSIADHFDLSKPAISHHLKLLTQAGLLQANRQGKQIFYSIDTTAMQDLMRWTMRLVGRPEEE